MRFTRVQLKAQLLRAEKRATAKTKRITQERNTRRSRRSIDKAAVFARDKGVCAECGLDTDKLAKWLASLPRHGPMYPIMGRRDRYVTHPLGLALGRHHARALTLLGRLWKVRLSVGCHLWEADHRTAIAEGGGDELSNLRTLCRRDHREATTALRGRLARRPTKSVGRGF